MAELVLSDRISSLPDNFTIRPNLTAPFHFYIGTFLFAKGEEKLGKGWLEQGIQFEESSSLCRYLCGFLESRERAINRPKTAFEDPKPFIQVSNAKILKEAKSRFVNHVAETLPSFHRPVRMMDIGCGDGSLTWNIIEKLKNAGKITTISELLLVEPSEKMLASALETVQSHPCVHKVTPLNKVIQQISPSLEKPYDIAICAISYHHMPYEEKFVHLQELAPFVSNIIFLEMDAEHDRPELYSPELAFSIYYSYGRFINETMSSIGDKTYASIDGFLLTEVLSTLTEPRGVRTEYHMRKDRWIELLERALGPEFSIGCDSPCYSDDALVFFTLHYGKKISS